MYVLRWSHDDASTGLFMPPHREILNHYLEITDIRKNITVLPALGKNSMNKNYGVDNRVL